MGHADKYTHVAHNGKEKKSLSYYADHKLEPCTEAYYRGDRSSALLFQARTGSLATQQRLHELLDSDPSCRLCGAPEETVAHILLACPRLHNQHRTSSLAELLGLASQAEEACLDRVNSTKNLLLRWERMCRQTESSSAGKTTPTLPSTATCTETHIDTGGEGVGSTSQPHRL
ncbi:hypothetical protein HPB50_016231 [Hyalomma asiaticum]|uniref:Uncharacterized protein n=1 Tax=Hyalomma asiaticum TaxID=266040 RepID=A0ACB7S0F9_HYAAI|nr:hypothetical protein HPB50_016231 [Hyalomma asiaticum]